MESSSTARVLVVAHKTAATPALLQAVKDRADRGPAEFHLLVPNPLEASFHPLHPEHDSGVPAGQQILALALPLFDQASGTPTRGSVSIRHDPMDAIEDALRTEHFDEIILSTLPHTVSRWLHIDLPRRVEHLGLPLTTVIAEARTPAAVAS
jgi:hypothetical protein